MGVRQRGTSGHKSGMGGYYSGPNRGPSACAIYWRDPDSLSPSLFETRVGVWFFLRPLTRGGLWARFRVPSLVTDEIGATEESVEGQW